MYLEVIEVYFGAQKGGVFCWGAQEIAILSEIPKCHCGSCDCGRKQSHAERRRRVQKSRAQKSKHAKNAKGTKEPGGTTRNSGDLRESPKSGKMGRIRPCSTLIEKAPFVMTLSSAAELRTAHLAPESRLICLHLIQTTRCHMDRVLEAPLALRRPQLL